MRRLAMLLLMCCLAAPAAAQHLRIGLTLGPRRARPGPFAHRHQPSGLGRHVRQARRHQRAAGNRPAARHRLPQVSGADLQRAPTCAGPFRLLRRVPQDVMEIERFDGSCDRDAIHVQRITYRPLPDATVRMAKLRAGALDTDICGFKPCGVPLNGERYCNPDVDAALTEVRRSVEPAARAAALPRGPALCFLPASARAARHRRRGRGLAPDPGRPHACAGSEGRQGIGTTMTETMRAAIVTAHGVPVRAAPRPSPKLEKARVSAGRMWWWTRSAAR